MLPIGKLGTEWNALRVELACITPRGLNWERCDSGQIKRKIRGVRGRMHQTSYISLVFTAWGEPTMPPAPPEAGDCGNMKKICLRPPLRFIIQWKPLRQWCVCLFQPVLSSSHSVSRHLPSVSMLTEFCQQSIFWYLHCQNFWRSPKIYINGLYPVYCAGYFLPRIPGDWLCRTFSA